MPGIAPGAGNQKESGRKQSRRASGGKGRKGSPPTDTPPRKRKQRATQGTIPGTQPKRDKALSKLASEYRFHRDERMEAGKDERAAKVKLIDYMKDKGIQRYEDPGADLLVELQLGKDNVKVSNLDKPPED